VLSDFYAKQVEKSIVVHYKDRIVRSNDVDLDRYRGVYLYSDVRSLASQAGFVFSKFAGFQWHPPNKEN